MPNAPSAERLAEFRRLLNEMRLGRGEVRMKKIVDVFVRDRLIASYPVVANRAAGPTPSDEHFVELVKAQMQGNSSYSKEDLAAAKFVVRGLLD